MNENVMLFYFILDIEADESSLLFLCQEWAISRYPRSNFDLSNVSLSDETTNDSSSSSETTWDTFWQGISILYILGSEIFLQKLFEQVQC